MVNDLSLVSSVVSHRKADPADRMRLAAPMPGMIVSIAVSEGNKIKKGSSMLTLEAMKMESTLYFENSGRIKEVLVTTGMQVESGDLLVVLN